jgi:hypothetical protein
MMNCYKIYQVKPGTKISTTRKSLFWVNAENHAAALEIAKKKLAEKPGKEIVSTFYFPCD